MSNLKKEAFEYLVSKLLEWYKEVVLPMSSENDLSILKVLKLTFFVSAVKATKDSTNTLLDNVFTEFYAMPYGHVESDVYSFIKKGELSRYSIMKSKTTITDNENNNYSLEDEIKESIDNSIKRLREINPNLIKMSSFDLVDLSHQWFSWKYYYNQARKQGIFSEKIPVSIIKSENKYFG